MRKNLNCANFRTSYSAVELFDRVRGYVFKSSVDKLITGKHFYVLRQAAKSEDVVITGNSEQSQLRKHTVEVVHRSLFGPRAFVIILCTLPRTTTPRRAPAVEGCIVRAGALIGKRTGEQKQAKKSES